MRVCVTGGSGMVGQCIKELMNNDNTHEFVYLSSKDCDLRNKYETHCYFQNGNFDAVIHLAANVGGLYKNLSSNIEMFCDNIKINENVLEASHKYGVRKGIFILSSCIYTAKPSKFPMDEEMIHEGPPHPSNEGYAYSKRMMEMQVRHYNASYGTNYMCLIPVNLYGPYDNFKLSECHVLPGLMHRFYKKKQFNANTFDVYGTGNPLRQFVYAKDFAKIICESLDRNDLPQNVIVANNEIRIRDLVDAVCDVMEIDKTNIIYDTEMSDGCMRKTVESKVFKDLFKDFKFTSLGDGIRETYEWFTTNYENIRK
tara:strand:+ start:530 stop:1465 length:936 start_codon:yes stop_codon:yes gene_type:complete